MLFEETKKEWREIVGWAEGKFYDEQKLSENCSGNLYITLWLPPAESNTMPINSEFLRSWLHFPWLWFKFSGEKKEVWGHLVHICTYLSCKSYLQRAFTEGSVSITGVITAANTMKSHCVCGDATPGSAELCGSEIMEPHYSNCLPCCCSSAEKPHKVGCAVGLLVVLGSMAADLGTITWSWRQGTVWLQCHTAGCYF